MSVKKRGDAWSIRFQVGGQKVSRSLGKGSTRQDALDYETQLRRQLIRGKLGHAPEHTIGEAIERWLDGEAQSHTDKQGDEARARAWLPFVEGRPLSDAIRVAAGASDSWLAAGKSAATINRRIALLRRVARLAHSKWGWLDTDLSRQLVAIPGEKQRRIFLSREQVMALVPL